MFHTIDDAGILKDHPRSSKPSRDDLRSILNPRDVTSNGMNSWRCLIGLTTLVSLAMGCGSSGAKKNSTLDTPSGAPEIVIQSPALAPILTAAREFFAGRGYFEVPSRHAYEVVFDRRLEGRKSEALRVRLRGVPIDETSWKLAGIPLKVEGWGGDLASENVVPYGFTQVQDFLEAIKMQVELSQ
jgi:hypothetical protein